MVKVFYPRWTRDELIRLLKVGLARLAGGAPIRRAVLFGSWAKGRATVASDVDLFLLYAPPERPDLAALVKRRLGVPGLEVHAYTEEAYARLRPVLEAMLEAGVELLGEDR